MANCYLLESLSRKLIEKKIEEIITKENFTKADVTYYDLEEIPLSKVLEDLDTYSFLTPQKVIVVSYALFLTSSDMKFKDTEISHIIKYVKNPCSDVLFIMVVDKCDERKKVVKEIKKSIETISLDEKPIPFAKNILQGYKIDSDAVYALVDACCNNLDKIEQECNKLKMYKLEDKKITKNDIKELVVKSISNTDNLVFDFVKYIAKKDKKNMFITYNTLKECQLEVYSIIGLIESQARLIYQVMIGKSRGYTKEELTKRLKEHPFRVQKTYEFLSYYEEEDIERLIHSLHELDYKIKSGQVDAISGFETFLIGV